MMLDDKFGTLDYNNKSVNIIHPFTAQQSVGARPQGHFKITSWHLLFIMLGLNMKNIFPVNKNLDVSDLFLCPSYSVNI
jgi:hypothetical protein